MVVELVHILVHKGNIDRELAENCMTDRVATLREVSPEVLANMAKLIAFDYFGSSFSSSDADGARAQAVVMQA